MTCGDVVCTKGTHIALDQGDTFGPFVAGPDGVELFEVMMGDPRSFPADLDGYAALPRRARRGAAAEPADRHARRGSRTRARDSDARRSRRARCRSAAIPHDALDASATHRRAARRRPRSRSTHGFDGVMTSEHHGGFAGYLPNPLQLAGLPARRDAAGLGRAVPAAVAVAAGRARRRGDRVARRALSGTGRPRCRGRRAADRLRRSCRPTWTTSPRASRPRLELVTARARAAKAEGALADDPAIARCRDAPDPGAQRGRERDRGAPRALARARACCSTRSSRPTRAATLVDAYRDAGGDGSCVLVRRAGSGEPPRADVERQVDVYKSYAPADATAHWGADEMATGGTADEVATQLLDATQASGADALNLRVHVPASSVEDARDQIVRLGDEVVPLARRKDAMTAHARAAARPSARRAARRRGAAAPADRAARAGAARARWRCSRRQPDLLVAVPLVGGRARAATACCRTAITSCSRCASRRTASRRSSGPSTPSTRAPPASTDDEIALVARPLDEGAWTDAERALLRAADELGIDCDITDATWAELAAHFDPPALVEILFVVGQYTMLSMVANAAGIAGSEPSASPSSAPASVASRTCARCAPRASTSTRSSDAIPRRPRPAPSASTIAHACTSLRRRARARGVDAVTIATPPHTHARARARGGRGRQARAVREAVRPRRAPKRATMLDAAERAGVVHLLGTEFRFAPGPGVARPRRARRRDRRAAPRDVPAAHPAARRPGGRGARVVVATPRRAAAGSARRLRTTIDQIRTDARRVRDA